MNVFLDELNASFEQHQNNPEIRQVISGLIDYAQSLIDEQPGADQIGLDFDSDQEDDLYDDESENNTDQEENNHDPTQSKYPFETQIQIVNMLNDGKTYKSIRHQFKKLKSDIEIIRIKEYVEKGGTKFHKLRQIEEHCISMFRESRQRREALHDADIVTAALLKARDVHLNDFKASPYWLFCFKKRNRIVSRRVTKIVGSTYAADEEQMNNRIQDFMHYTISFLIRENVPRNKIVNGDHTGVNLELATYRTLDSKGSKDVIVEHQKVSSTTHSYTVYPVMNCDGHLFAPFLSAFTNLPGHSVSNKTSLRLKDFCDSSTSGKMTTEIQMNWFKNHFIPRTDPGIVFILDAWTGYRRIIQDEAVGQHIKFIVLPEKTTSKIQPLDRLFNRQFKLFIRIIHEKIRHNHPNFNLSHRTSIGRILNETHFMFCAPIFENFIKYSWKMCGYFGMVNIPPFLTPPQFCFNNINVHVNCFVCDGPPFICCSYCSRNLCFGHFLPSPHRCNE